ncbi:MAG: hypothetical protein R6U93_09480 [Dehalococcoidia bacterium]
MRAIADLLQMYVSGKKGMVRETDERMQLIDLGWPAEHIRPA